MQTQKSPIKTPPSPEAVQAAATAAEHIERFGDVVRLKDGTFIRAKIDEDDESMTRTFRQAAVDALAQGRPAIFIMTDEHYRRIEPGTPLFYDEQYWTVLEARARRGGGVIVVRLLLCMAGANPV